jgi:hypothetical protein
MISARADIDYAAEAFQLFQTTQCKPARYHFFVAMVMSYCRPFTESEGIGSLRYEYPNYPDFSDAKMNDRHRRMMDIRNKFLGHSSTHGTRAFLLAPGSKHPANSAPVLFYHYAVQKRHFLRPEFVCWLADIVLALAARLGTDLGSICTGIGSIYLVSGEVVELDTGHDDFTWKIPKGA